MRLPTNRLLRLAALGLALVACNSDRVAGPSAMQLPGSALRDASIQLAGPSVRVAEFHYDNAGTDSTENIEISAPAGTNMTGWKIFRYNGGTTVATNNAATVYSGNGFSGAGDAIPGVTITATCGTRGVEAEEGRTAQAGGC